MMFKMLVAVCVITAFNGEPVNRCYLMTHQDRYHGYEVCLEHAIKREHEIMLLYIERMGNNNAVIQGLCIKDTEA